MNMPGEINQNGCCTFPQNPVSTLDGGAFQLLCRNESWHNNVNNYVIYLHRYVRAVSEMHVVIETWLSFRDFCTWAS